MNLNGFQVCPLATSQNRIFPLNKSVIAMGP